ncbi:MAG: hypothetical protein ACQESR_29695 [Planctomycetota bacterium]
MESCSAQAVLPLVGLAGGQHHTRTVYFRRSDVPGWKAARRKPSSRWSDSRADNIIHAPYISGGRMCPDGKLLGASRPPVGRTRRRTVSSATRILGRWID